MAIKTVKATHIKHEAENPCMTVENEDLLMAFMDNRGVKTLADAFRLGRLDMAATALIGTGENVRVAI